MECRPLADDLAPGARILEFVRRDTGEMIGSHVTNTVAAGLDRMHLDGREVGENIGNLLEFGPVVLDVLARRHMPKTAIVAARDVPKHAQLLRRQQPIGNRHTQHRRVALDIEAIAQAQVLEFVLRKLSREEAARLVAKLRDPLVDERTVDGVIPVHIGVTLTYLGSKRQYHHGMSSYRAIMSAPRRLHIFRSLTSGVAMRQRGPTRLPKA
jgi:hypothetical protein